VVASNEGYSVWVSDFEAEKKEERFERIEAAVNEVACNMISPAGLRFEVYGVVYP
jgi:hypothetical protein